MRFKVGDKLSYPAQGVAELVNIEEKDVGGKKQEFYVLKIMDTERKILLPVKNAAAVGLRELIGEDEIQKIFDILRERKTCNDSRSWNQRYRYLNGKFNTGCIYDVAEVLCELLLIRRGKQLSFGEKRMFQKARDLICKEIALSRGQNEDEVWWEIQKTFFTD